MSKSKNGDFVVPSVLCEKLRHKDLGFFNHFTEFDALVKQFNDLKIDSKEEVAKSVEIILEKAMEAPEFSSNCAKICDVLRKKKGGYPMEFRKLLIMRCQEDFERDYMANEGFDITKY